VSEGSRRRTGRGVALEAKPASILAFEEFVEGLGFLAPPERDRIKVAGGEILDNLVRHAAPISGGRIRVRIRRRPDGAFLAFYFRSPSFAAFAGPGGPWSADAEPLFDPAHRRWRGIGLAMCRNIARKLRFRPGERMDRIFLEF
jgi:hypothetical protein